MLPTHVPDRGVTVRPVLPSGEHKPTEWEVSVNGRAVGWVTAKKVGRSSATFFQALAVHPDEGALWDLSLSTDREERNRRVVEFWATADSSRAHRVVAR